MKGLYSVALACLLQEMANAAGSTPIDYSDNGKNWGAEFPLCAFGQEQTPIDLSANGALSSSSMQLNGYAYQNMPAVNIKRDANGIVTPVNAGEFQIDFADGSKSLFTPLQFHFHAPSEHTVDGKLYDMEMHIVHQYKDQPGALGAVIGIFFDREAGGSYPNPFIDSLEFQDTTLDSVMEIDNVNLASLLSAADFSQYWNYRGSLTTPPCTEGIKWAVLKQVQPISDAQLT